MDRRQRIVLGLAVLVVIVLAVLARNSDDGIADQHRPIRVGDSIPLTLPTTSNP